MKLGRIFYFDAAHHLPEYKGECEKFHGHTYRLEVVVESEVGMTAWYWTSRIEGNRAEHVLEKLDHQDLNAMLKNPTAENIVEWIWKALEGKLPLQSIRLWEGKESGGED